MNTLSWMIYGAEVFSRLCPIIGFGGVFILLVSISCVVCGVVPWSYYSWDNAEHRIACEAMRSKLRTGGRRGAIFGVVFIFFASVIPSSTTIYLIAASEAGEAVVTSPEAREMMNDLKGIIRKKLKEELGDSSEKVRT
jgi:hypothetical protein